MAGNGNHYTYRQREYLKQLVIEAEVQRFTMEESLAYVHAKLKLPVSERYLYTIKARLKRGAADRLDKLAKDRSAYIAEFFKRIDEVKTYQKELWLRYHLSRDDAAIQVSCIRELHQLSITLANLYEIMPQFTRVAGAVSYETNIPDNNEEAQVTAAGSA